MLELDDTHLHNCIIWGASDVISFTPSGGTGSSIGGTFHVLIRQGAS
jgi:hypothetical protein